MAAKKQTSSIQDWLESLDLGNFTNHFLLNGLTELHQVCHITEDQLSLIGITQRGYQKRILNHLPSEAEAFLSEFVTGSEKLSTDGKDTSGEAPPPMPPRRSAVKQVGKENGHPTGRKPTFDDESYLFLPSRPHSDSDRPSTGSISQTSLGDFKHVPVPPPRAPGSQGKGMALSSEIPNNQARMRPTPQPRARSDPSLGAKPPPLPGRDENPERPSPKLQPTPQVPPRVAPSQAAPQVPLPLKLFPTSFVEPNVYDDDPCQCVKPPESNSSNFLSPPPVFPKAVPQSSAQDAIDEPFPELPPPPPPKSFPGSAMPPAPAKRNVSPVPHLVHRRPPDPPNLESPSSQPRSLNDDILVDSRKSALQMPEECAPPPAKDSLLSPPPVLPFQSPSLCGSEEDNVPSLPPPPVPTTIPSIPPRPHLGEHPPISDVPPPPLPSKETPGHLQAFQMSGIQGGTSSVPFLPEPTSSIPIIPPRPPPSLLPGPSPSELQPLPHPQSLLATDPLPAELPPPPPMQEETPGHSDFTQPHQTDFVNIFDSAKETRDPFAFDPFTNNTEGTFSVDPPLRPPSLFLTQEDLERFPKPQLSVPPPVEELPSQSEQPVPLHLSRPAPNLSLLNRPVPLPPASDVLAPTGMPPIPQDHTPLETQYQALPELTKAGEGLTPHQSGELTSTTVVSQSGLRKPPAPPPRIPAGTEQKVNRDTAASPDITSSDQPTCMPAGLFHKTSDLIDLSSLETNAVTFKNVPAENERKSFLDTEYSDKPSRSTASPLLPVLHDPDDQYSKVHRSPKITQRCVSGEKKETPSIPQIPTRPPQIPPRQEPKGEAAPTFTGPERLSPIGSATQDDMYSVVGESRVTSWSSLQVPVPASPSGLSDSSDRHSYILLSEAMSGGHDIPDEKIYPDERPLPAVPLSSSTLDKPGERDAFQMEEDLPRSQHSQKPVRRAPPPPVVRPIEKSPSHIPKIPPRPAPAVKEFIPQLPPGKKEEEYDLLDPSRMVHTSPLRDEPVEGSVAFKELAQSEESGDDDDSGFDMDSLEFSKAGVKEDSDSDLNFKIDLADRRSKIDLSHVLRIGQAYQPEVPNRRLTRTHSRALDENTRKRLSKKLSQSLQDRNSAAETPTNKVTILTKQGYLWKQGGKQNNKGFRKRWMVFDGLEMRYYENEKKLSECKGIIPVGTMRDVKNLCGNTRPGFGDTRQYRIILETTGRSFHFAAETLDEGTLWANVLMQAILSYEPPPGGFPVGGDMSCPDKQGYVKIEGYHQKRFLAVKGEKLFMYNTAMDFESAVAILDIQMKLASVKELPKNKLQLATPGKIYILTLENPQDVKDWMVAMKDAIEEGLSDHSILEQMYQNPSNKYCADCRMKDPDWASINLGICVCKNCSGLHRELGVHLSKVRSLKMDTKVWTPALVQLIMDLGNDRSNAFWEAHLNEDEKAVPDDTLERRKVYIVGKYRDRKYCKPRLITDKNMNRTLLKAASLGNLEECVQLVFSGANVSYTREDGKTACDVAKECNFPVVAEFLNQNVGIKIVPGKNDAASGTSEQGEKKLSTVRHMARESKQEFIKKSGYLHKTGNNKKEFLKRFCTLEHGIFSYFEEKSQPAKNTIEGIEMILIAVTEPRQGHKFCFEIYTSPGRTYLLSAETEEDRKEWMIALAKIHSLECMWGCLEDFEQAGFLHKKEGAAATNWQRLWFILKGKSVVSFSSTNDQLEEIDLRKLISLSRQDSDSTSATDYTHTLSIVLPGKNIYLRAETKQAADCWYEAINRLASQGGQALEDQLLTGDNIPIIVSQCINFVATHDGIMTEGIYRLSGTSSVIRKIVTSFTEDPRTARLKEEYTVHDVTGALKKFFRELPDPLLTSRLYKKWTEVASYQDHSIRLQWYQHLLSELPPVNYHTLKMLIGHLKNVADHSDFNKMYFRNLAAIFGPTLMASPDSSYIHAEYEIAVIADLLTYYNWLYQVSEEEMAKEREKELKYQEGLSKIKAARASENIGEQLILMEIFLGKKDLGNSINIKISMDHTAAEIIKMALDQQKEINDGTWALFEIIAKGELERLIHGYERVLPQVLAWNAQMAPDNYICLKHNDLMDRIEPFMQQATLSDIVRYSESKKTFKKYSFELMNNVITCYKDKSTTPANSWKVADMKIYVGVEKKRSPPTQWGISFTLNNEEGMRAMCLEKEASFLFWLAGLLKSKGEAGNSESANAVVDPSSLTYSPHALSFKSEHESSFTRYSRNLPRELSNITSKMSFWRKSRTNSVDES